MLINNMIIFTGMLISLPTLIFAQVQRAVCTLIGDVTGTLLLKEEQGALTIEGLISNVAFGKHGIHIHEYGLTGNKCLDAGGHYNPTDVYHGDISDEVRHIGDYGNLDVTSDPFSVQIRDHVSSLAGEYSILGRTLVIHAGEDDLGRGGNPASKINGNSGPRISCCVVTSA